MFKFHFQDVVVVARAIFHKPLAQSLDEAIRRFLAGKEKDGSENNGRRSWYRTGWSRTK